jgi:hypothetical protein
MKERTMKMMIVLAISVAVLLGCGEPAREIDPQVLEGLKNYVEHNHLPPEEYLVGKFADHDVIFLGEVHRIKHDVDFVMGLVPYLHENGIYFLGTEFARREDQRLIDSLLAGPEYDETLAREITFRQSPFWGYQEYVDIFKAAWEVNRRIEEKARIDEDAERFRILALNDSPEWWHIEKEVDRDDGAVMKKVWAGGGENLWARVILDSAVARGNKILVHCGIHHAFTEYKQPVYVGGKFLRFDDSRAGNHVFREIGKRAITVFMHAGWYAEKGYTMDVVRPADGIIDAAMELLEDRYLPVGFDTRGTPFGDLPGETSVYKHGYDTFTLATFCDGYIYHMPFAEFECVTPILDFVNDSNIDRARKNASNPRFRDATVERFSRSIEKDAGALHGIPE